MIAEELMADAVEFVGGDARHAVPAHLDQGISCDSAGTAHGLDGLGVLDLGSGVRRRCGLVDVLRAHDRGRNRSAC